MHGHGAGEPEPEAEAEPVVAEGCGSVGSGGEDEALHRPTTPAVDGSMDEHNSIEEGAGREAGAGARLLPSHEDGLTGQSLEEWSKEDCASSGCVLCVTAVVVAVCVLGGACGVLCVWY